MFCNSSRKHPIYWGAFWETDTTSYDANGTPLSVTYNGTNYYYATNLQGDVTAILNTSGTAVVTYTYDAWGNLLTTAGSMKDTLGEANPLRYRGYVYDSETGLYYLQSRYYDPELGRFINADAFATTGQGLLGNNMFTYCGNNPENYSDSTGQFRSYFLEKSLEGGAAGIVVLPAFAASFAAMAGEKNSSKSVSVATTDESSTKKYSVYFLYEDGGDSNTIVYVGRVLTKNFNARMAYHETKGRSLSGSIDGLDYAMCRAIEQAGMMYHHSLNRGNSINNQIRGISPSNKKLYTYLAAVFDLVGRSMYPDNVLLPIEYWENFAENEFLNYGV